MILRSLGLALLLSLAGLAYGQEPRRSPMSPPGLVDLPEEGVTAALVPGTRLPMVEVYVGDAGPFRFVVEWAGNVFAVSERVRAEAGLETLARSPRGHAIVAVPEVRLDGLVFADLVAEVPPFFGRTDHDGALGLNLFRELVATLDLPGGRLHVSREGLPAPADDPSVVAYSPGPGGSPRIPVVLAGETLQAVLDTAAERALILDESYLGRLPIEGELRAGPRIMTPGMGELETREGRIAGALVIGAARSETPLALFHRMREPEVLLGGGFLRDYALTLDQANRRLRLVKAAAPVEAADTGPR